MVNLSQLIKHLSIISLRIVQYLRLTKGSKFEIIFLNEANKMIMSSNTVLHNSITLPIGQNTRSVTPI